jgi:16S rRNA G527 N7-methylase RsmG
MISPARENGRISPWPDKAVSRKVAKYAKGANQRKDFAFALLRAFATLRELFWFSSHVPRDWGYWNARAG